MRIRIKLFLAFLAVGLVVVGSCGFLALNTSRIADLTNELYDGPLMSISFSQGADVNFEKLQNRLNAALLSNGEVPIEEQIEEINDLTVTIAEDLDIVEERLAEESAAELLADVRSALAAWEPVREQTIASLMGAAEAGQPLDRAQIQDLAAANAAALAAVGENIEYLVDTAKGAGFELRQSANERAESVLYFAVPITIGTAILLAIGIAFVMGRTIARPLAKVAQTTQKIADGDKTVTVPFQTRRDEVGSVARAVEVFQKNAIRMDEMAQEKIAQDEKARTERALERTRLAEAFEENIGGVITAVSSAAREMEGTAKSMSSTARTTSEQATVVASAADGATHNVQTVASAAEELSASIGEISRQVEQSSEIAQAAAAEAERTSETVGGLNEAGQRIGEVVSLINDIAEQTNLLALNATIEAARAGDAGKGFSVVASEVKNLANQTATATDEISSQISNIQAATTEAVEAIEKISETIAQVNEMSGTISTAVAEQRAATNEISSSVQDAANGTTQVSSTISEVNQAAGLTGASAEQVQNAATDLSQQAESLQKDVDKFLGDMRAA